MEARFRAGRKKRALLLICQALERENAWPIKVGFARVSGIATTHISARRFARAVLRDILPALAKTGMTATYEVEEDDSVARGRAFSVRFLVSEKD
jgi:hypothetical protein